MSGARVYGARNGNCKYSDDVVLKVRGMVELGISYSEISRQTKIPYTTCRDMVKVRKLPSDLEKEAING